MKELHLITVGKLKDAALETIENNYLKRINQPKLSIHEVKAVAEDKDLEAQHVLKKISDIEKTGPVQLVLLEEWGKEMVTLDWHQWLEAQINSETGKLIFIIGGAQGHGDQLKQRQHFKFSLSKMTFPHKLARILLIEQIYRAQTLRLGHPYHNE